MRTYKYEIFTNLIEKNIREGVFKPGHKLPSVRELKEQFPISISTIQSGYDYLVISGLVESIPKSGYFVSNRPRMSYQSGKTKYRPVVRDAVFKKHLDLITSLAGARTYAEFNVAAPGDLLIPQKLLLRTMQEVIREQGASLLRYYPSNGSAELRANIAERAAAYQAHINPDELIITDGALQALYIALASVCNTGDIIAVESPCVFSVLEVIRVLRLKVIEIPIDPYSGFDVDVFRKACCNNKVKAAVITTNFHNPTGLSLSDEQKRSVLNIAQQYHVTLIENDIYGDLNFHGQRPSTLRSFDDSGMVLTYSSFAKTLAPGIRLGWLAAAKYMERAEQVKFALGSTVTPLFQETVNRLISGSSYDRHIRAFRLQLAKNAFLTMNLLSEAFPEKTAFISPQGGYNIWVKMPEEIDMNRFYNQCDKIGVRFTPGYTFSFSGTFHKYFRIVFADKFTSKKIAAIKRAGRVS